MQSRLIVSGMSSTRCDAFNVLLVPLVAIVVGVTTLKLGTMEAYLLVAYAIYVLAAHLHYGICVVSECVFGIVLITICSPL